MQRMRIERRVAPRRRDELGLGLVPSLDPRDPDIVRAKQLLRDRAASSSRARRGE